ncbi:SusC/RagA family TonB-linked outer membrane protein [Mucilaginibacter robiniae]|uniref:SusC/RagA family TonB-linked outer membrane protein n=1 Tax=Mucilaginibacter robiniae TaxID=2728022 RepID=A0A7L5DZJ1_9SPHI|nr:SusC/RagA family TonB-linked outer membrane protein [Mucilaginibacter robiniae]QJD96522.1 SusC/RagA family TonB-linked outer membrane protein [Mucilaginibacter robiniae]
MKKTLLFFLGVFMLLGAQVYAQTRTVTGVITGKDDGLPLPGVSVTIQGTKTGTQTGPDGSYTIKVSPGQALVFTFVGFNTQTITPSGNRQDIVLTGRSSDLNEVVVVGYGTQVKRATVGTIAQVKGSDLIEQPVQNFEQALAGRAPGVQVTIPNGVSNTPPVIHIRGVNSISLSSQPLFVVDGVVSITGDLSGGESGGNALANINPDDIESISIAKDGAATAIYGSRAANGVVFVTTKRGKKGNAIVSLDSWIGQNHVFRLPKVLDANQYISIKNEALVNAGLYNANSYYVTTTPDANGVPFNTNWAKLIYRTGTTYNTTASVSGGTEKTNYYASANYSKQEGIIRKNDFISKGLLFNVDHKANKYISLGAKLSYVDQQNLAATSSGSLSGEAYATAGLGRLALLLPPNIGAYNADGSYNLNPLTGAIGLQNNKGYSNSYPNPKPALDLDRANNEQFHTAANVYLQVKPLSWITLKTQYGIDYINSVNDNFTNPISNFTVSGGVVTNNANANDNYQQYKRYVWSNTLQLDRSIVDKHNFSFLLGNEQQRTTQYGFGLSRSILSDIAFNQIQAGFVNVATSNLVNTENYLVSFFGRLNYDFDKKYFLSATVRRDGYSAFGSDHKYGIFPGVGVSWEITREKFWSKIGADKLFSSFRLKGSYAQVGNNAGLNNYASYGFYGNSLYNANPTLAATQAGNNALKWETSRKTDVGLNFGIFGDRITGELAYYKNDISGLILNVPLAPSAGLATNPPVNVGSMFNKGLEIDLNADIVRSKNFRWSANFNIAFNQNKITSLIPGTNYFTYSTSSLEVSNINQVGHSIGSLYLVNSAGVDPTNGRRIFINGKGQKVEYTFLGTQHWYYMDGSNAPAISQAADAHNQGNTVPKETGGFSNSFHYKNFDLNVLFTYQLGFYVYYGTQSTLTDQRFWNNSTVILDHWTTPGQIARYPQVVFGDNVSNGTSFPTDFNTYRGDFLKFKTVNLGYTLPKSLLGRTGLSSLRVYVTAQNLFIITKYPGPDPEVSSNGDSINGNSTSGVDRNTSPNSRSFTAGFSIKF